MTALASVQSSADTAPLTWFAVVVCLLAAVLIAGALFGYAAFLAERERVRAEATRNLRRLGYRRVTPPEQEHATR